MSHFLKFISVFAMVKLTIIVNFLATVQCEPCMIRFNYGTDEPMSTVDYPITTPWPALENNSNGKIFSEGQGTATTPRLTSHVSENAALDIPFTTGEAIDVAYARSKSPLYNIVMREDNVAEFYPTELIRQVANLPGRRYMSSDYYDHLYLRCTDGTIVEQTDFYVRVLDENNQSPVFSLPLLNLSVIQAWPIELPVNSRAPLYVTDEDYIYGNGRVSLTLNRTDIVRVELIPLFSAGEDYQYNDYPFDYRMEIFLVSNNVPVGDYPILVEASDRVHKSYMTLNVKITEVVCKSLTSNPIFGKRGQDKNIMYYNGTITTKPSKGDTLSGVILEAFAEDENCDVSLSTNVDFLNVLKSGELEFSRELSADEVGSLGSTWIIEVEAKEETSGRIQKIPLILTSKI